MPKMILWTAGREQFKKKQNSSKSKIGRLIRLIHMGNRAIEQSTSSPPNNRHQKQTIIVRANQ